MATKKKDEVVVENKRSTKMAYRLWLNNKVQSPSRPLEPYSQIIAFLFRAPFEANYPGDDNRIGDIIQLRGRFGDKSKIGNVEYLELMQMEPTILELMISLALRMNEMSDNVDVPGYFWDMMVSLGLNNMDDTNFNFSDASKIIDTFTNRTYQKNGKGGLFWAKKLNDNYDAPHTDLWTQSQVYLNSLT